LPGAEAMQAQLLAELNLPGCREIPVVRTSPSRNQGISELWDLAQSHTEEQNHA